jgi:hypothetical protein
MNFSYDAADNHMINGTKLLNVAGMTRGRRDGILKSEKMRHVVKIGPMHLKGVWYVLHSNDIGAIFTMAGFPSNAPLTSPIKRKLQNCSTLSSFTISELFSIIQQIKTVQVLLWLLRNVENKNKINCETTRHRGYHQCNHIIIIPCTTQLEEVSLALSTP